MARKTTSNASSKRKSTKTAKSGGATTSKAETYDPANENAIEAEAQDSASVEGASAVDAQPAASEDPKSDKAQKKAGEAAKPADATPGTASDEKTEEPKGAEDDKPEEKAESKSPENAAPVEPENTDSDAEAATPEEPAKAAAEPEPEPEEAVKPEPEPKPQQPVPSVPAAAPEQKSGVFPAILAGIVAGGLGGFGASYYFANSAGTGEDPIAALKAETNAAISEQQEQISALKDEIAANVPDLSGIESTQAGLQESIGTMSDRLASTEDNLDQLNARLSELQQETLASALSEDAIAAYKAEFAALQDAMVTQRAEIEAMAEEARQMETSAEETAQATMRRSALSRIQTALDTGSDFSDALADFEAAGGTAPSSLTDVPTDGVASLSDLQSDFPALARTGLSIARDNAAQTGETGGATSFLRNVLGARSLEPREGSDPDAVLSRAEAAVRENRLQDAIAEIETLPEAAQAPFSDWKARVGQRLAAIEAAQSLSEELN